MSTGGYPFPGNERPLILAHDFDGYLFKDTGIWMGTGYIGAPIEATQAVVRWARQRGWTNILWTCRQTTPKVKRAVEPLGFDYLNENAFRHEERGDSQKIKADVLLDDKCYNPFVQRSPDGTYEILEPDDLDPEEIMAAVEAVLELRRRKIEKAQEDGLI